MTRAHTTQSRRSIKYRCCFGGTVKESVMLRVPFRCLLPCVVALSWLGFTFLPAETAHAASSITWTRCTYQQSRHVQCATYRIAKPHRAVAGSSYRCRSIPRGLICRRFPIFVQPRPAGFTANYFLTIYSRCDTPGQWMADGTSVYSLAGQYGAAATYPGYPGGLAFGTRVLIYSLHRIVTIHDRGSPAYFQVPHIDIYDPSPGCSLFNNFAGLGSHYETVFVYS